jgi:tRNA 2-thiouridine synthesizing protein A
VSNVPHIHEAPEFPDIPGITVEARGRRCPLPIIDLAKAARAAPAGTLITLVADDPAAAADVAAWCRMRGHLYEGSTPLEGSDGATGMVAYRVRLRPSE